MNPLKAYFIYKFIKTKIKNEFNIYKFKLFNNYYTKFLQVILQSKLNKHNQYINKEKENI